MRLSDEPRVVALVKRSLEKTATPRSARELVRPPSPWRWLTFMLVVVGSLTFVQIGAAAMDHLTTPRINQACNDHDDCVGDEQCLKHLPLGMRYCTRACATDAACPDSMHCGDITSIPEANRGVGAAGPVAASSACIR